MGAEAIAFPQEAFEDKYNWMAEYLSSERGYWEKNDKWYLNADSFQEAGIKVASKTRELMADFSGFQSEELKVEMKYYLLFSMKEELLTAIGISRNYKRAVASLGKELGNAKVSSFDGLAAECREPDGIEGTEKRAYQQLYRGVVGFITDYYDDRDELEKDTWHAARIPGAKLSATEKRSKNVLYFEGIPKHYRETVKRFMGRLAVRRGWSFCREMLQYIRYFFRVFYEHGYTDGFFERLQRKDVENYLGWAAADYAGKNATFRSKAVSFIRRFIDYIQLAEYPQAPGKDVNRLIFDDDIPKRERYEDTIAKVKYIPEPVREQLDASIYEIEPAELMPVYVLLRESGWRGTDVLNLRHDSCLEYLWNAHEQKYISYLCGEITKTGIPLLKIPIRQEVADMVKKLTEEAAAASTEKNNPEKYLFNTYEGRCKGLPYSKPSFSAAMQALIDRKGILDGDGKPYHFKAHSLRHTRAMEYTEQGMPIGIIQQVLGHCSLQMTLHYSKVSENMLYEKWKETEKLHLLHLDSKPLTKETVKEEGIHFAFIRKNLDAVKVPFGVCFKPSKLPCRQQMKHCLDCANFCTGKDNIPEYEAEIRRVRELLETGRNLGRSDWTDKNQKYLEILEKMLSRIQKEGTVHKNGRHREEDDG